MTDTPSACPNQRWLHAPCSCCNLPTWTDNEYWLFCWIKCNPTTRKIRNSLCCKLSNMHANKQPKCSEAFWAQPPLGKAMLPERLVVILATWIRRILYVCICSKLQTKKRTMCARTSELVNEYATCSFIYCFSVSSFKEYSFLFCCRRTHTNIQKK